MTDASAMRRFGMVRSRQCWSTAAIGSRGGPCQGPILAVPQGWNWMQTVARPHARKCVIRDHGHSATVLVTPAARFASARGQIPCAVAARAPGTEPRARHAGIGLGETGAAAATRASAPAGRLRLRAG